VETYVLCDRESQADRLAELLEEHGAGAALPRIGAAPIHAGFSLPEAGLAVLTDHEIFGRPKRTAPFRRGRRYADPSAALDQFNRGDYVVHADFGIGRYHGLKTIKVRGVERECVQIEYREDVKVYVRLDQFSRLQKYQGTEGAAPVLSKIGGRDWERARKKTEEAVEQMAEEILSIYARRQVEGGYAFRPDTPWQREMEAAFEFEDTQDQAATAEQIKRDMEKPVAMDRVLVGDVGFGKTEVAIRAAFKAIQDSKQVAVLVPTTILAAQHHATFVERLRRYPIRVEVLSRFRSRKEQQEVLRGLAAGEVDLVIGTHRLLSQDIHFKDLGLLIVDEEHRFGVKHKEKLKALRVSVDVLSMSATPIPRTLHMALSGARDMSMISTPPQDRLPIETEVVAFDERVIREAVMREVARGGQVYFVHNRVETIYSVGRMLERLLGEQVGVRVAHGQMKERELETVMDDFLHERFQVLVCTMIIESGLDIPNVNTLIVNRADRFGIAQLYQLRGRIGRSHRQAYAWLLTPPRATLAADARRRLESIAEHTRLGSGFQIAMRDLEIRGAGNLLGAQQSGFINSVGFELYTEMLGDAVKRLGDQGVAHLPEPTRPALESRDVKVEVALDAMLPADYVNDASERVELYRRLSRSKTPEQVQAIREELRDRFGPLPALAVTLLQIVEAQTRAARAGVAKVELEEEVAFLGFREDWAGEHFDVRLAELVTGLADEPIELRGTGPLGMRLELSDCTDWEERWQRLQQVLGRMPAEEGGTT
jgi:transcription-repair coupling factor (superfamily II helicase)